MQQTLPILDFAVPAEAAQQLTETSGTGTNSNAPEDINQRLMGVYYTPRSAADFMADWVVRRDREHILEPSFGDGIFLRAVTVTSQRKNCTSTRLSGIEIDCKAQARVADTHRLPDVNLRCADFLDVTPFKVDAVIGNPPYVRLRHLSVDQRERALSVTEAALDQPMDPSGSLWMPFVLHAMSFLQTGGRLAFVLPYDFTYVRYARPLWATLRNRFGSLRVLRTHERLFPDILQDVVILLADDFGSHANAVHYQAFERVTDLLAGNPVVDEFLDVDELIRGERVFIDALLGVELRRLLNTRIAAATLPARKLITFNIGYVAGDKSFFHPSASEVQRYQLPPQSLHPSLTSTRSIKGMGLCTSSSNKGISQLFLPDSTALTDGESRYIASGQEQGVAKRYKCRIRAPWFIVPGTRVPDVILSVFSECPALLINDAGYFASNSLLCGYCTHATSREIATAWYTSLTLLQCELEVHALGGGVMVMVPGEAGNVRLPRRVYTGDEHMNALDRLLRAGRTTDAYRYGDRAVLTEQLGLNESDIELIRHGSQVLAHWRTSARSS